MHYSIGWDLGARERAAIGQVPRDAWDAVLDIDGKPRDLDKAGVVELTGLLREHPDGDQLANWPKDLRILCRREKPHPGRATVPVRRNRRVALPTARHQHPWQYRAVPRSPPPPARPRRRRHPLRQTNRTGPPALRLGRDQPSMVPGRQHRLRPVVLAAPALPARPPDVCRTENPALPAVAHRRPPGARPTQTKDQNPGNLALGRPTRRLLPSDLRPAQARLTASTGPGHRDRPPIPGSPTPTDKETTRTCPGPGAHPTRQPDHHHAPHLHNNINNKDEDHQGDSDSPTRRPHE